jgi:hypothetical protein
MEGLLGFSSKKEKELSKLDKGNFEVFKVSNVKTTAQFSLF